MSEELREMQPDVGDEVTVVYKGRAIRAKVTSIYESTFDKRRAFSMRLDRPILHIVTDSALRAPGGGGE